jgi:hypothetical protein
MSNFTIPNSRGEIRQVNSGDLFGELNETFNIDLTSSQGKIKVSDKLVPILKEGIDIGNPAGFVDILIWDGTYYLFTEEEAYTCSVVEADSGDPKDPSNWSEFDIDVDLETTAVVFDGQLRISLGTNIARWDGDITYSSTWWTGTVSGTALIDNVPHVLEVVQSQKETLYVTDGSRVQYLEKGGTPKIVELDGNVTSCCLAPGLSGAMWVGTYNKTSGKAQVYEIYTGEVVGSTPTYRQAYPVNARAVLAIWTKDNIPYIVTEKGEVQMFNGAGFTTVAEFPFKYSGKSIKGVSAGLIQDSNRSRPIHPRGVAVHEDSAFINIATEVWSGYAADTRSHSGVWEFNMKTNVLNHRFAFAHQTNDYGESKQENAYPLLVVDNQFTFLMAGGFDEANNSENFYMTDSSQVNQGWFITPEITSGTVADAYESIYHKAKTLADGEEIVTMYRTSKRDTVYGTANWVSTTQFVTTDDWSTVEVGDLVRVSHGYAAGDYANITAIEPSATTYTVTVDKAIGADTETSYVYSDNFKKDPEAYTSADGEWKRLGGYGTNPWIQFAVFLKGDIEYKQFICKSNSKSEL